MWRAYHKERKVLDMQLAAVRQVLIAPHLQKGHPVPTLDQLCLFADSAPQKAGQSPEQMLDFVKNVLHPHFQKKHEEESKAKEAA